MPLVAARCSGVQSHLLVALTSAPQATRRSQTSVNPRKAAKWSGVYLPGPDDGSRALLWGGRCEKRVGALALEGDVCAALDQLVHPCDVAFFIPVISWPGNNTTSCVVQSHAQREFFVPSCTVFFVRSLFFASS